MKLQQIVEWYVNYPLQLSVELPLSHRESENREIDNFVNSTMQDAGLDYKEVEAYNGHNTRFVLLGFREADDAVTAAEIMDKAALEKGFKHIGLIVTNAEKLHTAPQSALQPVGLLTRQKQEMAGVREKP